MGVSLFVIIIIIIIIIFCSSISNLFLHAYVIVACYKKIT
jgi:hypothetical protein